MFCFECDSYLPYDMAHQMREHYFTAHSEAVPAEWLDTKAKKTHYVEKIEGRLTKFLIQ